MRTIRTLLVLSAALPVLCLSNPQAQAVNAGPTRELPDLSALSIGWGTGIKPNGLCKMFLNVTVWNIGRAPAGEFWVAMFYAGQMAFKTHVSGLPVFQDADDVVHLHGGPVVVEPGHYLTETYIDWHDQVVEVNEENDDFDGEDCPV